MESPRLLWSPTTRFKTESNLHHYLQWLRDNNDLSFNDYHELWNWSVNDLPAFWESLWRYFNIIHDGSYQQVCSADPMPHTQWFSGTRLNYAEHVFRMDGVVGEEHQQRRQHEHQHGRGPAIVFKNEDSPIQEISWQELRQQVAALQHFLRRQGVQAGDRIVAYMPCIPEASVALLASASLGAVWSSCSPDFGVNAVIDRFAQIEPKVLIAVDQYRYGGKVFDKTDVVRELVKAMPSLECVIVVSDKDLTFSDKRSIRWESIIQEKGHILEFVRVPFDHPIWVLYSSGTTGLPKAITHSQGGILLEQLKYGTFHNDFKPGERCFWYTTTGWMMWNYIHGSLLAGGTMVLYDGSPAYPDLNGLWKFTQDAGIHHFGTSAGFILANLKANIEPSAQFDLSALRSIGSTGSTLPPEGFDWVYRHVKEDLWLASMSGGTDVCSAFVGGTPLWPVYAGEIQCRALGCKLEAFDEQGKPVTGEVGEMVISAPMPSMPVYFWNDPAFKRYHESYFEMYAGVWRHGDWITITPRQGVIIYGRSDATLNRGGVRIGTSEIYRAVDKVKEVKDSLILCIEKEGGEFWMPLFVVMHEGETLSEDIRKKINTTIRSEYSPRHVPDEIIAVPDVPYTISGKKTETPVKKVLMGKDPAEVVNAGALKNPGSMEFFIALAKSSR
ncbi:acetoacetate--CoA ligase [Fulvivirgaceae bacterium PWU4]|uniref:Acetoacetate--CoA ligase n=1 Tax=Chryseosolibacter histidini TaxID=2782349 RepID=A0AAP2DHL7_9BACT|nr:acetoacetate--CoA ligase [Chryseosolibacter histidini]MBT1695764.1 acetoacetate--CoA ligase [Chryseosolibacter histidini]